MKKLYFVQQEQMLASYKHAHPHFIDSAEFNPRVDCDGTQIASYFLTEEEAKARFDECETEFNEINYKMVEAYIWSYGHITMEDEDYDEFLEEITLGAEPKADFPSDFDEYEYYEYSDGIYTDCAEDGFDEMIDADIDEFIEMANGGDDFGSQKLGTGLAKYVELGTANSYNKPRYDLILSRINSLDDARAFADRIVTHRNYSEWYEIATYDVQMPDEYGDDLPVTIAIEELAHELFKVPGEDLTAPKEAIEKIIADYKF